MQHFISEYVWVQSRRWIGGQIDISCQVSSNSAFPPLPHPQPQPQPAYISSRCETHKWAPETTDITGLLTNQDECDHCPRRMWWWYKDVRPAFWPSNPPVLHVITLSDEAEILQQILMMKAKKGSDLISLWTEMRLRCKGEKEASVWDQERLERSKTVKNKDEIEGLVIMYPLS